MKLKKIAILVNNDKINIDYILDKITQDIKIDDVVIFSDLNNVSNIKHRAVLSSFYLKFFDGSVVFTNVDEYLTYKDQIIANEIFLVSDLQSLLSNNIDKSALVKRNTKLIPKENDV